MQWNLTLLGFAQSIGWLPYFMGGIFCWANSNRVQPCKQVHPRSHCTCILSKDWIILWVSELTEKTLEFHQGYSCSPIEGILLEQSNFVLWQIPTLWRGSIERYSQYETLKLDPDIVSGPLSHLLCHLSHVYPRCSIQKLFPFFSCYCYYSVTASATWYRFVSVDAFSYLQK